EIGAAGVQAAEPTQVYPGIGRAHAREPCRAAGRRRVGNVVERDGTCGGTGETECPSEGIAQLPGRLVVIVGPPLLTDHQGIAGPVRDGLNGPLVPITTGRMGRVRVNLLNPREETVAIDLRLAPITCRICSFGNTEPQRDGRAIRSHIITEVGRPAVVTAG